MVTRIKYAARSSPSPMELVTTTRVATPNRIASTSEENPKVQFGSIYCDGKKVWVRLSNLNQYMEDEAPKDFSKAEDSYARKFAPLGPVAQVMLCPNKTVR